MFPCWLPAQEYLAGSRPIDDVGVSVLPSRLAGLKLEHTEAGVIG